MMRNIPFPFLMEETLESIAERAKQLRESNGFGAKTIRLAKRQIARQWNEIEEHKWFLSERLGRDIGAQVAATDYFDNISKISEKRGEASGKTFAETVARSKARAMSALEGLLDSEGLRAFGNMQRIMRGVPNTPEIARLNARNQELSALPAEIKAVRVPAVLQASHGREIEEHKWFLSERLGRDVGNRVAAVDYFENVKPQLKPVTVGRKVLNFMDRMMEESGPNSIANLERAMRPRV